uniref:Uncharacterized protein n=1 Tax=Candidatus Kentrum sp. TUN TaxID=2126343 RepID=A0A450ZV03_9GAMM|nr:MAG: hypothetical protein BECKTUN1418F_GA0071002_11231 [Candidatus Kentron sp. TUN]VFK65973.1 MAG: hypothetical protein BECKTUN1418E_GA0071001_11181 [Candidatus Kentron sp. TUN]
MIYVAPLGHKKSAAESTRYAKTGRTENSFYGTDSDAYLIGLNFVIFTIIYYFVYSMQLLYSSERR